MGATTLAPAATALPFRCLAQHYHDPLPKQITEVMACAERAGSGVNRQLALRTLSTPPSRQRRHQALEAATKPSRTGTLISPIGTVSHPLRGSICFDYRRAEHSTRAGVYAISLAYDGSPQDGRSLLTLPAPIPGQPICVKFVFPAGGIAGRREPNVVTDYPVAGESFQRGKYHRIRFKHLTLQDPVAELEILVVGVYSYFVEWISGKSVERSRVTGHILIEPRIAISGREVNLPLPSLVCQSLVPKWMGPLSCWEAHFEHAANLGYNMFHFLPLQKRGESNSPYSIADQLSFSDDLFNESEPLGTEKRNTVVEQTLSDLEARYGITRVTDVVYNHTANTCDWLRYHPEAGYNLLNSPHLGPAYVLDEAILEFSGNLEAQLFKGYSNEIKDDGELKRVMSLFEREILGPLNLWQFYVIDVASELSAFESFLNSKYPMRICDSKVESPTLFEKGQIFLTEKVVFRTAVDKRYGFELDFQKAYEFLLKWTYGNPTTENQQLEDNSSQSARREALVAHLKAILDELNLPWYQEFDEDLDSVRTNLHNTIRYQRLDCDGPRLGPVTRQTPLVWSYFTRITPPELSTADRRCYILANNGWIWNADPSIDFASPCSKAYLRREVIVWGDCVKLRYGESPDANPWLWAHMEKYTRLMARIFHGFRIDNAHSTPIHVAKYFLDIGRSVRPNLFIIAELFTGSEETDLQYVQELGIHCLIREAMQAWDAGELSRLVHRYSGEPVGSLSAVKTRMGSDFPCLQRRLSDPSQESSSPSSHVLCDSGSRANGVSYDLPDACKTMSPPSQMSPEGEQEVNHFCPPEAPIWLDVTGASPFAMFFDCTHDNPMPAQKRTVEDTLSNAALVAFSSCTIGSVRGYDEIFPKHLDIVKESRLYSRFPMSGIAHVRKILNKTHVNLAVNGTEEAYVHHEGPWVLIVRQNPKTHKGLLAVIRTAFPRQAGEAPLRRIKLDNTAVKFLWAANVKGNGETPASERELLGIPSTLFFAGPDLQHLYGEEGCSPWDQVCFEITYGPPRASGISGVTTFLQFSPLTPPGSVHCFETNFTTNEAAAAANTLQSLLANEGIAASGLADSVSDLSLVDLNIALYRCEMEERDVIGQGAYHVPGYGDLTYCGLEGFISLLRGVVRNNDLGHPLCNNLREGFWMLDYVSGRLSAYAESFPRLRLLERWFEEQWSRVRLLPQSLVPKYFSLVMFSAYFYCRERCAKLMSPLVGNHGAFVRSLAQVSFQMCGVTKSAGLYPPEEAAPFELGHIAAEDKECASEVRNPLPPSMAAGLPHFATQYMRCWGRDTFIALPGLFRVTGLFTNAREHILAFASVVRHGQVPNLLDGGRKPRYNARDSTWFFLEAIQDFCRKDGGAAILSERCERRFYGDKVQKRTMQLHDIVQEIMQRHAEGIDFREWFAGPELDHAMRSEGFNVQVWVDWDTGMIYGGNEWNCGTWMDKMGESEQSGNKGYPASPRNGACIEIVGLLKSALRWLSSIAGSSRFPHAGVQVNGHEVRYEEWNNLVQRHFEKRFWIPQDASQDRDYDVDPSRVVRRGIYKDTHGSQRDYQDRPNQFIAMVVAPELFNQEHAIQALASGKANLTGPLGMKTLDPSDREYHPYYHNSNESSDWYTSKGFNYHLGPEWVWVMGFFLRACLAFERLRVPNNKGHMEHFIRNEIEGMLAAHRKHILEPVSGSGAPVSSFVGLPELTNKDGEHCPDSCPTQAWSAGCLLELCRDIHTTLQV